LADSDKLEVGDLVLAVGNPFAVGQTVTMGIISALGRGVGITGYEDFIQTDAAINPGNSGGALVDSQGRLVGINTAIYTHSGGYQGVGFAVPVNLARFAMENLIREGKVTRGFLGAGIQTCRKLIDDGAIGQPVAAVAFLISHGHESWHPDPEFYYKPGGGPMFDMGPYYLTALVNLLGPVRRVTGSTRITFPQRVITSQPKAGTTIQVEVPTHVAGVMDFANGAVGTIITTFDVWGANLPHIEVYGTEGSLSVPNPNAFGGPVKLMPPQRQAPWQDIPLTHGYAENSRGLGVADLACALRSGRAHRAGGDLAYHVLEVMHAFQQASEQGRHVLIQSTAPRPAPLPTGLKSGQMDA